MSRCLKEAIQRLRAIDAQVERAGRAMQAGPALLRLVEVIERAEAILARGAGDDLVDAAIAALRYALDATTAEISLTYDLTRHHA